jgi:hypothetical protein
VYDYAIPECSEKEPYFFDPEDAKRVTLGHAAAMAIANEHPQDTPADDLISYLSYRELTGYELYDGYYDGYPDADQQATSPASAHLEDLSVLDLREEHFKSRAYAVTSWHRVLHENLHPK